MPALRLSLYQKSTPSFMYKNMHPKDYKNYQDVLSFEGCYAFASEDELTIQRNGRTIFRTSIRYYESDFLTVTYVGKMNDVDFRFLFANNSNPLASMDPMVTFASMSPSGWAVHYRVRP